ncbi:unnamed protein product, partial [Schistosoma turkestanicum]
MSLFILCIISIWHAVVTLIGLDFDLPDSSGLAPSLPSTPPTTLTTTTSATTTATVTSPIISSNPNVNNKTNHGHRLLFFPKQSILNQSDDNSHRNISTN